MTFEKVGTVLTADELMDKAFSRASRAAKGKIKEITDRHALEESMVLTAGNILADNLYNNIKDWPSIDNLSPFYREITDIVVGADRLKKSLASLGWASAKVKEISRKYVGMMRKSDDPIKVRKQAYGRMASIVYDVDSDLKFLNDARNKLRNLPDIKEEPTIVVAGYPNVGKSSFVADVTGAKPEIAQYPFTTKSVAIGHFVYKRLRYQVIDTPGLLDRPLEDRNDIERQAISALRYVGNVVLFIVDPSENCGYPIKEQYALLDEIKDFIDMPVLIVANKTDLESADKVKADMRMSTLTKEGVLEVRNKLVKMIQEHENPPVAIPEEKKTEGLKLPPSRKKKAV
jgi:nucleolar GTP-binding protein